MKAVDDYSAKYRFWAERAEVRPLPKMTGLPRFGSQKFNSHQEMNDWKRKLLAQIAAAGGCQWTRLLPPSTRPRSVIY